MGWETRGRHRRYTRSIRRGRRVVRQYVGTGPIGELAAEADALARTVRARQAAARLGERTRWREAKAQVLELERLSDLFVQAALLCAGYHRHGGQWRRSRNHG
jgi:hypothetical protein